MIFWRNLWHVLSGKAASDASRAIQEFEAGVRADERWACAKIAEECAKTPAQIGPLFNAGIIAASEHIAAAIRARREE